MHDLLAVSALFQMRADFIEAVPFGSGHINDTYCAWYNQAGRRVRYIHQRVNHHVFKNPVLVMENIERVTRHALDRLLAGGHPESHRRTLTCVPARDGSPTLSTRTATSGGPIRSSKARRAMTKSSATSRPIRRQGRSARFRNSRRIYQASGCTRRSRIFTTRPSGWRRWKRRLPMTSPAAPRMFRPRSTSRAPAPRIARGSPTSSPPAKSRSG